MKKIKTTPKSGHRCASVTCITWISCITCIICNTCITCIACTTKTISPNYFVRYLWRSRNTCTTEISQQLNSWDIFDIAEIIVKKSELLTDSAIDNLKSYINTRYKYPGIWTHWGLCALSIIPFSLHFFSIFITWNIRTPKEHENQGFQSRWIHQIIL